MSIKRLANASITGAGGKSSKLWDQTTTMGAYESIATATVTTGGASVVTIDNIPQGYTNLQLRGTWLSTPGTPGLAGEYECGITFNGDTYPGTGNMVWHVLGGNGSSPGSSYSGASNWDAVVGCIGLPGTNTLPVALTPSIFILDILDYSSTAKYKTLKSFAGTDLNGSGSVALYSGLRMSNNAITSLSLWSTATGHTFSVNSQFALYGIRCA